MDEREVVSSTFFDGQAVQSRTLNEIKLGVGKSSEGGAFTSLFGATENERAIICPAGSAELLLGAKSLQCCRQQRLDVMHAGLREFDDELGDQLGCRIMLDDESEPGAYGLKRIRHIAERFRLKRLSGQKRSNRHNTRAPVSRCTVQVRFWLYGVKRRLCTEMYPRSAMCLLKMANREIQKGQRDGMGPAPYANETPPAEAAYISLAFGGWMTASASFSHSAAISR